MCSEYRIVYDILWTLSFNTDIQQQLRSQSEFMTSITHLAHHSEDDQMRKITSGILWNLGVHDHDRQSTDGNEDEQFDIMISYSHKDKELCHQLYGELVKRGFRVWIDFDQMHGNVMDAMAEAIEHSQMVIICMSEEYRRSNFCRAEAQYAFQRQRKMVPVLLQKHYKPDGWLSFLIGQLLYVDFTKHEFGKAMGMLLKELKPREDTREPITSLTTTLITRRTCHVKDWTKEEVQEWFMKHELTQLSQLLAGYDGRSVLYFHQYVRRNTDKHEAIALLNDDAIRRLKERLSLVELFKFISLIDQER